MYNVENFSFDYDHMSLYESFTAERKDSELCFRLGTRFFSSPQHTMVLQTTQLPVKWHRGPFPREVQRPEHEADHSPPSSVEVKNLWR